MPFMEHIEKKKKKKKKGFLIFIQINLSHFILLLMTWSEMTLNDWVIVQNYPFPNPRCEIFSLLDGKKLGR